MPMDIRSNTPLRKPPADYCPEGSERWFTIAEGLDSGKTLFFSDHRVGDGEPEFTVLFVHGNPENSYTYRHVRDHLIASGRRLRIVAPDHIGFGLSDQADFEMVEMHHAANLLQLVRHLDLCKLVLVIHDWGGPIGAGAMIEEPDRVAGLAVMNTTVFPMPSDGYTYKNYPFPYLPWFTTATLIPDALWGGVAAAVVSHASPQGFLPFLAMATRWMTRHARDAITPDMPEYPWSQQFTTPANIRSSKRNVRQTPRWGHGYRYTDKRHGVQDNHGFYRALQARIGPAWKSLPACGYFGQWDACGKDSVIAQWHEALPRMREATHRFADIGHFIEEYKGPEIGQGILDMMR